MVALEALGCTHVLLDSYCGDVEATRTTEPHGACSRIWRKKVLNLDRETQR